MAYKAMTQSLMLPLQHLPKVETIRAVAAVVGVEEEVVPGVVAGTLTQRQSSRLGMCTSVQQVSILPTITRCM